MPGSRGQQLGFALSLILALPTASALAQSPQPSVLSSGPVAPLAPLTEARQRHTATTVEDGSVLIVGGWAHGPGDLGSMERYDPATGTVTPAGDLVAPRSHHTATLLPDGSVLVAGGSTNDTAGLASAELVTPSDDPVGQAAVVAVGDLTEGRAGHVAVPVLGDGHVLIVGGAGDSGPATTAELFDPVTRTFTPVPGLTGDLLGASAVSLSDAADAKVLVSGGATGGQWLYDPATGLVAAAVSLPAARTSLTANVLSDGRVLLIGGTDPDAGSALGTTLIWDPATDGVMAGPDLATGPRTGHSATRLSDGRIYIASGTGPDGEPLATAELYDPTTQTTTAASAAPGRRYESTVTAMTDSSVVVIGGSDGRQTLGSIDVLRPTTADLTVVLRVRPACDGAQVLRGRGRRGLPVNDDTGAMHTTKVVVLQPRDLVAVDQEPLAGGSYDSSCTGAADYRWYRVRAVYGSAVNGWVTAQVLSGGAQVFPVAPPMLDWTEPERVARTAFDDITVDPAGVVHAVTVTDTGLVYTTNGGGRWTSEQATRHADKDAPSRPIYEGEPSISAADGLVVIAYEDRRADPIGSGDCAPGPCWEAHGVSASTLRGGSWTAERVARSGEHPSVVTRARHTFLAIADAGVVEYLTNVSGSWRTERLTDSPQGANIPMIAVDSKGRPQIAIGQERSPSKISYAHRQGGSWKLETVVGRSNLLAGITVGTDDVVRIGYTAVRDRYPGDLCFEDCDEPLGFHVRTLVSGRWRDRGVPGTGFGVFAVDGQGRASTLRSDDQLAWRAERSDTWLTRSWKRPWKRSLGTLIEPVQRQWIEVVGGSTYLFYRGTDGATWMIVGTLSVPTS